MHFYDYYLCIAGKQYPGEIWLISSTIKLLYALGKESITGFVTSTALHLCVHLFLLVNIHSHKVLYSS